MKSPLKFIYEWFAVLPVDVLYELSAAISPLHCDPLVRSAYDDFTAVACIFEYLEQTDISYNEMITRTILMTNLIEYCLYGKNSLLYWKNLQESLEIFQREEAGLRELSPQTKKSMLEKLINRKEEWLAAGRSWKRVKEEHLSIAALADFEQRALIETIKRVAETPYKKKLPRMADIILSLSAKPDWLTSFMLMKKISAGERGPLMPFFLSAPFTRIILSLKEKG